MSPDEKGNYSPINREQSESLKLGDIAISSDVIASIAAQAASKVEGVTVVASSFNLGEIFGSKDPGRRGVAVKTDQESGHVEINVVVDVVYGVTIYDAAHDLQRLIKEEVEALTGSMNVDHVNIRVKHLLMPEEKQERDVVTPDQAIAGNSALDEE
jgi:uncharacterized alkaline shock family protein YloU